jgi:hypothetical protein
MRRGSRFRASTLLLAVVLSAAPAFARGHQPSPPPAAQGLFGSLWHALEGLFPAFTKGRGTIDPDGALTDGRSTIDPDGATSTAPAGSEADGRAGLDPDG